MASSRVRKKQESEQSLQSPREGDQVDILTSKGTISKEIADQDGSKGLKGRQESTQLDSPKELSKSQKKRLQKKEKKAEKRKREQEEDQESGDASNRFDEQDDTNIDRDSADRVKNRRKKKKKKKKQSSDKEEISVNKDNAKEEISVNGDNDGNNIFLADLFNTDYNGKLKGKEKTGI